MPRFGRMPHLSLGGAPYFLSGPSHSSSMRGHSRAPRLTRARPRVFSLSLSLVSYRPLFILTDIIGNCGQVSPEAVVAPRKFNPIRSTENFPAVRLNRRAAHSLELARDTPQARARAHVCVWRYTKSRARHLTHGHVCSTTHASTLPEY